MRYTQFSQQLADAFVNKEYADYNCYFNAEYVGYLREYGLIFRPRLSGPCAIEPKTGMPQLLIVDNRGIRHTMFNDAFLIAEMLEKKYPCIWEDMEGYVMPTKRALYHKVVNRVDKMAQRASEEKFIIAYAFAFWEEKKKILRERYHIRWTTPAEFYPQVIFE